MKLYLLALLALTPAIEAMTWGKRTLSKATLGHVKTASASGSLETSTLATSSKAQDCPIENDQLLTSEDIQGILMDLSKNQGKLLMPLIDDSVYQTTNKKLNNEQILQILDYVLSNKKLGKPNSSLEFDEYGNSPLHVALKLGKFEIANLLLQHGAKDTIKNKAGQTPYEFWFDEVEKPLAWEEIQGILIELLKDQGKLLMPLIDGSVRQKTDKFLTDKQIMQVLNYVLENKTLGKPNSPHELDAEGNSPLYVARKLGKQRMAALLLQHGAKDNVKNAPSKS